MSLHVDHEHLTYGCDCDRYRQAEDERAIVYRIGWRLFGVSLVMVTLMIVAGGLT